MEVDKKGSIDVDGAIERCQACLKTSSNDIEGCFSQLYPVEKQTRLNADAEGNKKIQLFMVNTCFQLGNLEALVQTLEALGKKRSVIKQAVSGAVSRVLELAMGLPSASAEQVKLLEAVNRVSEGRIYVEVERARATRSLAAIFEGTGKLQEAAALLQELPVETFGSLEKAERVEFILEQLRLLLVTASWAQAQIVARKLGPRAFEGGSSEEEKKRLAQLRLRHIRLMAELSIHERRYLDCSRHQLDIYQSTDELAALQLATLMVVLAPYDKDQSALLHSIVTEKAVVEGIVGEGHVALLRLFVTKELIRWALFEALFASDEFAPVQTIFADKKRIEDLRNRVVEHNLRVIAGCFASIRLVRLAALLELPEAESEAQLCRLTSSGMLPSTRIDRIAGAVTFKPPRSATDTLNDWASATDALLALLVRTGHAISKEEMALLK